MKIAFIPDPQVKPKANLDYLTWIGAYLADKRPDVIVCAGDFADMPSLQSYDKPGSKSWEGRRYVADIDAAHRGMELFITPLVQAAGWTPRLIMTMGNHEQRITRMINEDPRLEGVVGLGDLGYEQFGWQVVPFLRPAVVSGVHFAHYFPSGVMGRPCTTARKIISTFHGSCVAGHQQGLDVAYAYSAGGVRITSIIAGSCYPHNEGYLTPLSNNHWRGLIMLHDVKRGAFDPMFVSLDYLKQRFKRHG